MHCHLNRRTIPPLLATALSLALCWPAAARPADADWPPRDDGAAADFRPDVFPSERAAVRAVGRDAAAALAVAAGGTTRPALDPASTDAPLAAAVVYLPEPQVGQDWQPALEALRDGLPAGVRTERRTGPPPADRSRPAGEAWVVFSVVDRLTEWPGWSRRSVSRGRAEAAVYGPRPSRTVAARWEEKPWADDSAAFASAAGPDVWWVVGRAGRPCASRVEAEQLAVADAAAQLAAQIGASPQAGRVRAVVPPAHPPARQGSGSAGLPTAGRPRAADVLSAGATVRDRFARRYSRSYGDVWDAAVLVDGSPHVVRLLAQDAARQDRQWRDDHRESVFTTVGAGLGMMAVIGLLYALVNALTKGYFVRRLRTIALCLLAGSFALIVGVYRIRAR